MKLSLDWTNFYTVLASVDMGNILSHR